MPLNLELKVKLNSLKQIENNLQKLKAEFIKELNQKDVYYKIAKDLVKLRIENGEQSLIRYNRDEKGKDRFSDYEVLYFSSGNGEKFLNNLFKVEAVVEKKRLLYMYDNTRIHIDKVKELGYFLELETLVINGKADAKKRFNFIVDALELELKNQIKKSYRDLIKAEDKKSK